MMTFLKRLALKRLSDNELKTLYLSVQNGMIQLEMQRYRAYWIEEAVVSGVAQQDHYAFINNGMMWADHWLKERDYMRRLIMSARPQLFEGHREDYLAPYRELSVLNHFWDARPTAKKYKAIMAEREANTSYSRSKS